MMSALSGLAQKLASTRDLAGVRGQGVTKLAISALLRDHNTQWLWSKRLKEKQQRQSVSNDESFWCFATYSHYFISQTKFASDSTKNGWIVEEQTSHKSK